MKLYITEVEATFEVDEPWRSPGFGGSVLHGALGRALRRASCVALDGPCSGSCANPDRCGYARLFEAAAGRPTGHTSPFVPLFPTERHLEISPERPLRIGALVLGSRPGALLEALLLAFEAMEDEVLVDEGPRVRIEAASVVGRRAQLHEFNVGEEGMGAMGIRTLAPMILEEKLDGNKERLEEPSFAQLFAFARRRMAGLCAEWGELTPDDEEALERLAAEAERVVALPFAEWTPKRWLRYGDGRPGDFEMHGTHGVALYGGRIGGFVPLFEAAARVGIGKSTAFGLGRFEVEHARTE